MGGCYDRRAGGRVCDISLWHREYNENHDTMDMYAREVEARYRQRHIYKSWGAHVTKRMEGGMNIMSKGNIKYVK